MEEKENVFVYTYSASQHEEVKKIRERYLPKEESKIEQLRRLDESTTRKGRPISLSVGTGSSLILGIGMCCTILWKHTLFIPGLVAGCMGLLGVTLTFPLYTCITQKAREQIAPEILRLTSELLGEQ